MPLRTCLSTFVSTKVRNEIAYSLELGSGLNEYTVLIERPETKVPLGRPEVQ
jgi:hypothetical protein